MRPEYLDNAPAIGFAQQIIIYAKGWYGHSGDEIADIRAILARYAGMEEEHIHESNVREHIVDAFVNYVENQHCLKDAIIDALGWGHMAHLHQKYGARPEQFFLSKLAIIKGKYVNLNKKFDNISFSRAEVVEEEPEETETETEEVT